MTRSPMFDLFRNADYHGNCKTAYRATISVVGEAYRAAVWRLGAKSLLLGEFCGRGCGNEPRRLRQKLLPQSLLHVLRTARAGTFCTSWANEEGTSHRSTFPEKFSRRFVFPLPAVTDSTVALFVVSTFLFDCDRKVFIILKLITGIRIIKFSFETNMTKHDFNWYKST